MLQPDTKDDVLELCRSVQMDPTAYKHFELPVMAISAAPAAVEDAPPDSAPYLVAPAPCEPAPCEVRGAQSIRSDLSALVTVHKQMAHQPLIMPIVSGVGGSGATTILAGLGRALSIIGERVLLVDAGGPSTLDCFYESDSEHSGLLLSTESRSAFEGQVHVLRSHAEATGGGTKLLDAILQGRGRATYSPRSHSYRRRGDTPAGSDAAGMGAVAFVW